GYHVLGMVSHEGAFWQTSIASHDAIDAAHHVPGWVPLLPLLVAISGIVAAWYFYSVKPGLPGLLAKTFPALHRFLLNKWYFDELYEAMFVAPAKRLGKFLWKFGDEKIIDGLAVNGSALVA